MTVVVPGFVLVGFLLLARPGGDVPKGFPQVINEPPVVWASSEEGTPQFCRSGTHGQAADPGPRHPSQDLFGSKHGLYAHLLPHRGPDWRRGHQLLPLIVHLPVDLLFGPNPALCPRPV